MKVKKNHRNSLKTKNLNLENKKSIFFQIGLILSLAFVLLAFEWKSPVQSGLDDYFRNTGDIPEIMVPVTVQKEKQIIKPKPVIKPFILEIIDDGDPDDDIEFTVEIFDDTENSLDQIPFDEPDEVEEPQIFKVVEHKPEFPGGLEAMYSFLSKNLKYPSMAREANISGIVHVSFVVWPDGSLRDIHLIRGIGGGCDEEALRVVNMMPNWSPGIQRTKKVHVSVNLPIRFVLVN